MATTAQALTDNDIIPIGKYAGKKKMIDVPAIYLLYCYDNNLVKHDGVKQYIINNMQLLRNEAARIPKR